MIYHLGKREWLNREGGLLKPLPDGRGFLDQRGGLTRLRGFFIELLQYFKRTKHFLKLSRTGLRLGFNHPGRFKFMTCSDTCLFLLSLFLRCRLLCLVGILTSICKATIKKQPHLIFILADDLVSNPGIKPVNIRFV